MRTILPPRGITGDGSLLLLVIFLVLSAATAALIGRYVAEPLNRTFQPYFKDGRQPRPVRRRGITSVMSGTNAMIPIASTRTTRNGTMRRAAASTELPATAEAT